MRGLAALVMLSGCHLVFGLDDARTGDGGTGDDGDSAPGACASVKNFDVDPGEAQGGPVNTFAVDEAETFYIFEAAQKISMRDLVQSTISDLPFTMDSYQRPSLSPDGKTLYLSKKTDHTILRSHFNGTWSTPSKDLELPPGYPGRPDDSGTHIVVTPLSTPGQLDEWALVRGSWVRVATYSCTTFDVCPGAIDFASLTADGYAVAFVLVDTLERSGVYVATRAYLDEPFAEATRVLAGVALVAPTLTKDCTHLWVSSAGDGSVIRRP